MLDATHLAEHLTADLSQLKQEQESELDELEALIKQTGAEIERLLPEKNELSRKLREMESSSESVSRLDLRRMYTLAQESSMRLYMMQSRLEQLQYKQKVLQRSIAVFDQVLHATREIAASEPEPPVLTQLSGPEIAQAVLTAREVERHKLARELHDFTAQLLASLILRAQICERAVDVDQARARDELRLLREAIAERLQATRLLIFELQPQVLDELGLAPTIRRYIQLLQRLGVNGRDRSAQSGAGDGASGSPAIELSVLGVDRRYPHAVEIGGYRIVQEALRNALRHAQASRIHVAIADTGDQVQLAVTDDGRGFAVASALAQARKQATGGLADLLAEAAALAATLSIESEPTKGTRVTVSIPV